MSEWISVKQELPTTYGEYWIQSSTGYECNLIFTPHVGWMHPGGEIDEYWNRFVRFWRPLKQNEQPRPSEETQ